MKNNILVLAGAVVGGLLGHLVAVWAAQQGFYALILPGGLAGLGAGVFRDNSILIAVICGLLGIVAGLFTEWKIAPFYVDSSLGYFISHLHQLKPVTMIMVGIGGVIAFWVPFRRRSSAHS